MSATQIRVIPNEECLWLRLECSGGDKFMVCDRCGTSEKLVRCCTQHELMRVNNFLNYHKLNCKAKPSEN